MHVRHMLNNGEMC